MTRWLAVGVAFALVGCVPSLQEGFYGCATGECPDGWHCWSDGLCRSDEEPQGGFGASCESSGDCESMVCGVSLDPMARTLPSLCTTACSQDADCGGEDLICVKGNCRLTCVARPDCPPGFGCHLPIPEPPERPPSRALCARVVNDGILGQASCRNQPECQNPGWCLVSDLSLQGVCSMWCQTSEHCPGAGICVTEIMEGHGQCLLPCEVDTDCEGALVCRALAEAALGRFCVPEEWADQPLPLPGVAVPPPPEM